MVHIGAPVLLVPLGSVIDVLLVDVSGDSEPSPFLVVAEDPSEDGFEDDEVDPPTVENVGSFSEGPKVSSPHAG